MIVLYCIHQITDVSRGGLLGRRNQCVLDMVQVLKFKEKAELKMYICISSLMRRDTYIYTHIHYIPLLQVVKTNLILNKLD